MFKILLMIFVLKRDVPIHKDGSSCGLINSAKCCWSPKKKNKKKRPIFKSCYINNRMSGDISIYEANTIMLEECHICTDTRQIGMDWVSESSTPFCFALIWCYASNFSKKNKAFCSVDCGVIHDLFSGGQRNKAFPLLTSTLLLYRYK